MSSAKPDQAHASGSPIVSRQTQAPASQGSPDSGSPRSSAFSGVRRADLPQILAAELSLPREKSAKMRYVEVDGQRAVLKDYASSGFMWRNVIGPLLVRREVRALRDLDGRAPVPRLFCVVDRRAFIMEAIHGELCSRLDRASVGPAFFDAVAQAVDALHEAGWVHCDLKSFGNLVRLPGERIAILDLATGFPRAGWGGPVRRRLFARAALLDRMSLAKLKVSLGFEELLTDDERAFLAHPPWVVRVARAYRVVYELIRRRNPPRPTTGG
jgi:hypothetical protein